MIALTFLKIVDKVLIKWKIKLDCILKVIIFGEKFLRYMIG